MPRARLAALLVAVAALSLSGAALGSQQGDDLVEVTARPADRARPTPTTVVEPLALTDGTETPGTVTPPTLAPPDVATAPFSQVFGGVLRIRAYEPGAIGVGTGFVVGDGHWLLTNKHVVDGADYIELETWDGRQAGSARLVGTAPLGQDLALLALDAGPRPALVLRTGQPASDEPVVTAGYPEGLRLVRASGAVQGRARSGGHIVLVTDLPCVPGCSGSPVLDVTSHVVGVIVGGTPAGQTLAIPIEDAVALLRAHDVLS